MSQRTRPRNSGGGCGPDELRFVTYLSPSIPAAFFEAVAFGTGRTMGCRTSLRLETEVSGPEAAFGDPFSSGEADVGFMCAPPFVRLRELDSPSVELLGAPVFRDVRASGSPVYFSEVVVRREDSARSFRDLGQRSWAYNDACSLSGYYSLLDKLAQIGADSRSLDFQHSGSHLASIELLLGGEVDAAAIDSNVLAIQLQLVPELRQRLRVIESWGPFPIQPVVVRSSMDAAIKDRLRAGLTTSGLGRAGSALCRFGLRHFVEVADEHYASEKRALRGCRSTRA
ncbi:MAG: PhnD/SsuA/transferrin family substrate-binding protein [Rubrobacteraceae bacterium]